MAKLNVVSRHSFDIEISSDVSFPSIYKLLEDVSPLYPNFEAWLNFTFRRNLLSGERKIAFAHDGDQILGAALLKQTKEESKICTFFVAPRYRGMDIGHQLMDASLSTLDNSDTIITVAEERNLELAPLLTSKGFRLRQSIQDMYRQDSIEFIYSL